MTSTQPAFTIGALAQRSACSIDTIRYYERLRLMPRVPRSGGGHRLYNEAHLRRVRLIRRSRALGLSLAQVRELIDGAERNDLGCERARALLLAQVETVRRRLAEIRGLERTLRRMLTACGDATENSCRVLEAALADEAADADKCCAARRERGPKGGKAATIVRRGCVSRGPA